MNIFSRGSTSRESRGGRRLTEFARQPAAKWGALALLIVVLAFVGWLGLQGVKAKSSLEQSRSSAQQSKDALLSGDAEDATRFAENSQFYAEQARTATHSLPWNVAAAVPWLGSPFKAGQQISDVVVGLTADVLTPAARAGVGISPDTLFADGRVNVQLLRENEPVLSSIAADANELNLQAEEISQPAFLSPLRTARTQLQEQTAEIAGLFSNTALAARLAPSMMGADGPRTYLMAFQTNAEARGTGGLLGGFGVLRFNNGKPTVDTLAPNTELSGATAAIDLGPEFNALYGWANAYTDFRNSNLSSHFPYAAQIWKSMWERQSRLTVDGVIAIDPVALSYVLGAVGPVTMPDGEVITQDNVVELTESTAYVRFPTDQTARKKYLQDIANQVVLKLTGRVESPRKLLDALGRAASERRIAVWSASPADKAILEETPLAHAIPDDPAPYAEVIINNLAGNKMDYYLEREIEYAADGCDGDMRNSTITVRLTNSATDKPLPDYVAGTIGLVPGLPLQVPKGTMVTSVRLLATKGAKFLGVISGGKQVPVVSHTERGRPIFEVQVAIPPGQSGELSFRLSEPTSSGEARVPVQPLVDTGKPTVSVPQCDG